MSDLASLALMLEAVKQLGHLVQCRECQEKVKMVDEIIAELQPSSDTINPEGTATPTDHVETAGDIIEPQIGWPYPDRRWLDG